MPLHVRCPQCDKMYHLNEDLLGKRVRCKGCQETFIVRASSEPGEDEVARQPNLRPHASKLHEKKDEKRERLPRRRKSGVPQRKQGVPMSWVLGTAAALIVLGVGIGGLVWALRGKSSSADPLPTPIAADERDPLKDALAELDRQDPDWRMSDLQRKRAVIPERANSALQVLTAKKLLPNDWPAWPVTADERVPGRVAQERSAFEESLNNLAPTEQLSPLQVKTLRLELTRAEAALAEAYKLVDMPVGRYHADWSGDFMEVLGRLPLAEPRAIAGLLGYDALLRAQEQDLGGALTACRAALNAGRSLGDEPTLLGQIVRIACRVVTLQRIERVLAQGSPPEAALEALQRLLEDEAQQPILLYGMRGERAFHDWYLQAVQEGRSPDEITATDLFGVGEAALQEAKRELQSALIKSIRATTLRLNTRCLEIAKLPPEEQGPRIAALAATVPQLPKSVQLGWKSIETTAGVCRRNQAELWSAAVAVAVERYRHKHQRWPADLNALIPDYLQRVPVDPCDAKPLRYRRLSDGVVIYSVGLDGQDHGGNLDRDFTKAGTDRGIRLWDVARRRQPRP